MKTTLSRIFALLLALAMMLTMLVGCDVLEEIFNKGDSGDSSIEGGENGDEAEDGEDGGNTDDGKPDDSTVTDPTEIKTKIYEIAKHGNLILYMYGKDLYDKGYMHGDVVEIAIGDKK